MIAEILWDLQARRSAARSGEQCSAGIVYNHLGGERQEASMTERISEAEFQQRAEDAIARLERAFGALAEDRDIDVRLQGGVLSVEFEEPERGKFIVSPNSSARQLWISARMGSYKFDWSDQAGEFLLAGAGETLSVVTTRLTREQLGETDLTL
jgi:CyaY protein